MSDSNTYSRKLLKTLKDSYDQIVLEENQINACFNETKSNIKRLEFLIDENKSMFLEDHIEHLKNQKSEFNRYQSEKYLLGRIKDTIHKSMKDNGIHWLAIS